MKTANNAASINDKLITTLAAPALSNITASYRPKVMLPIATLCLLNTLALIMQSLNAIKIDNSTHPTSKRELGAAAATVTSLGNV